MREIIHSFDYVPRSCTWELTLRCNLNCGHCGSRAGKARDGEMGRDTMLRVMGELAVAGCKRVTLSGGEPTISEHWQAVASEGARLGVRMNMITNGVNVGRDFVLDAKNSGLCNLGVSLDGLEAEHERIRGRQGLFGNVMDLLDQCQAEKLPVGVVTTVSKANFRQLEQIHELIAGRVFIWQLQIGAAMGNLRDHLHDQIAPEDLLDIVPAIAGLIQKQKVAIRVADNVGYFGPYEEILRKSRNTPVPCWIGCYAGCRHVGIEADGGVKGCLSIQASTATEGNLQIDSFADIWRRKGAFAYNREFKLDDLEGFCRTCVHAQICRGGCLSMRTCEGGKDNPFCYHRVATLADLKASRTKARYIPMVIAPAALLAMIGCGGGSDTDNAVPDYGILPPHDSGVDHPDTGSDEGLNVAPKYGLPDGPPVGDAYGIIPPDTGYDGPLPGDAYGITPPDTGYDGPLPGDAYGIIPPPDGPNDAVTDNVDKYGMPDPDAAAD